MTISYPLSLPATKDLAAITLRLRSVVAVGTSPFTGKQQVQAHQGQWWEAECSLPPMERADAEEWLAFLLALNGREGTFLMGDPKGGTPRGTALGSPQVNGAGQSGNELATDGWTVSQSRALAKGDYFSLGSGASTRLYKMVEDEASDGAGAAALTFQPKLRSSPENNAALTVTNAKGLWRLSTNEVSWSVTDLIAYGIVFAAREAL